MSSIPSSNILQFLGMPPPKSVEDWEKVADDADTDDLEKALDDDNASTNKKMGAAHELAARGQTENIPTNMLLAMANDPRASDETKAKIAEELGKRFGSDNDYSSDDSGDSFSNSEMDMGKLRKWEGAARNASTSNLEKAANDPFASPEKRMAAAHELAARGKTENIPTEMLAEMAQDPRASDHTKANIAKELGSRAETQSSYDEDIY